MSMYFNIHEIKSFTGSWRLVITFNLTKCNKRIDEMQRIFYIRILQSLFSYNTLIITIILYSYFTALNVLFHVIFYWCSLLFLLTSHVKKPVHLDCLIAAVIFSWSTQVFQTQFYVIILCTASCWRNGAAIYLFWDWIEALQHVFTLVCWFLHFTINSEMFAFERHKHSGFQG